MGRASFGTNDIVTEVLQKYSDMVRRICFIYLRNYADVEDVFQDVFLKLILSDVIFESDEHIKAWLCKVTINKCKDYCKSFFKKRVCSIDELEITFEDKMENEVMHEVLSLPPKYRDVLYLYYYEGYNTSEIAKLLNKKENTVYSNLHRARKILKQKLGGLDYD